MKLYYYKNPDGVKNFGDDLNPWLWARFLPGLVDTTSGDTLFVGIGTLLNDRLPVSNKTIVFSTGVGYGTSLPKVNDSWAIYCVRGPLSAQKLKLPKEVAVTDGAVLIRRIYSNSLPKKFHYSYINKEDLMRSIFILLL